MHILLIKCGKFSFQTAKRKRNGFVEHLRDVSAKSAPSKNRVWKLVCVSGAKAARSR